MDIKGRILIADDEPDILEIVSFNLQNEGYEVITAKNGDEAIEEAKKKALKRNAQEYMERELSRKQAALQANRLYSASSPPSPTTAPLATPTVCRRFRNRPVPVSGTPPTRRARRCR